VAWGGGTKIGGEGEAGGVGGGGGEEGFEGGNCGGGGGGRRGWDKTTPTAGGRGVKRVGWCGEAATNVQFHVFLKKTGGGALVGFEWLSGPGQS